MQRLEVSCVVRTIYGLLGAKWLTAENDERDQAFFFPQSEEITGTAAKDLLMSKTTVWRILC
jgi:hypothetical protein